MTFNAKASLDRARRIIQDETNVRWPLPELRLWLNDALREIALLKPTAFSKSVVITLVAGTYQRQDEVIRVMHVTRNLKSTQDSPRLGGRSIRSVDKDMLDATLPEWHDAARTRPSAIVKNVCFDDNEPMAFWVYPPNDGNGIVEAIVAKIPDGVPAPPTDNEADINAYDADLDVSDIYSNAILDYMLYRAYAKEAQFAASAARAAAYYQAFSNAIGVSTQNDVALKGSSNSSMSGGQQ